LNHRYAIKDSGDIQSQWNLENKFQNISNITKQPIDEIKHNTRTKKDYVKIWKKISNLGRLHCIKQHQRQSN
jgi:hypothetical protein